MSQTSPSLKRNAGNSALREIALAGCNNGWTVERPLPIFVPHLSPPFARCRRSTSSRPDLGAPGATAGVLCAVRRVRHREPREGKGSLLLAYRGCHWCCQEASGSLAQRRSVLIVLCSLFLLTRDSWLLAIIQLILLLAFFLSSLYLGRWCSTKENLRSFEHEFKIMQFESWSGYQRT